MTTGTRRIGRTLLGALAATLATGLLAGPAAAQKLVLYTASNDEIEKVIRARPSPTAVTVGATPGRLGMRGKVTEKPSRLQQGLLRPR